MAVVKDIHYRGRGHEIHRKVFRVSVAIRHPDIEQKQARREPGQLPHALRDTTGGSEFPVRLKSREANNGVPADCDTTPTGGTGRRKKRANSPQINSLGMQYGASELSLAIALNCT
jgi:hypothetical protein